MLKMDLTKSGRFSAVDSNRRLRRWRREAAATAILGLAMFGWCSQSNVEVRADDASKPAETQGNVDAPAPAAAPATPATPTESPSSTSVPRESAPKESAAKESSEKGVEKSPEKASEASSDRPAEKTAATPSDKEKPRELSTPLLSGEPQFNVDRSQRPTWVEKAPTREGEQHTASVSSTPHATQRAAFEALDTELVATVAAYIDEHLDSRTASANIRYTAKEIKSRFVKEPIYLERGELTGSGPMYDAHAQLVFDSSFRQELEQRWREVQVANRLFYFGSVAGGLIVALGIVRWRLGRSRKAWLEPSPAAAASAPVAAKRGLKSTFGTAILVAGSVAFLWATIRFLG